eukprot:231394-Hanusia_phi.AAC.1
MQIMIWGRREGGEEKAKIEQEEHGIQEPGQEDEDEGERDDEREMHKDGGQRLTGKEHEIDES